MVRGVRGVFVAFDSARKNRRGALEFTPSGTRVKAHNEHDANTVDAVYVPEEWRDERR